MTNEIRHVILGVDGLLTRIERSDGLFSSQTWEARRTRDNDSLTVTLRFDDQCRNGHMDFSATATLREKGIKTAGGRCHELIVEWFPELAPLTKWHLVGTNYPMHYIANTVYHASDRDHWGLRKGEKKPVRKGGTGPITWRLVIDDTLPKEIESETEPKAGVAQFHYEAWCHVGEGKAREFDHARSSAVWPEATDEQLSVSTEELTAALTARFPALMAAFKTDMVDVCGFEWREAK